MRITWIDFAFELGLNLFCSGVKGIPSRENSLSKDIEKGQQEHETGDSIISVFIDVC